MAAKKKTKKLQQTKSERTAGNKMKPTKKSAKKKAAVRTGASKKRLAKKKPAQKKAGVKTKPGGRRAIGTKAVSEPKKKVRRKNQTVTTVALPREGEGARSGKQSGDLEGLSSVAGPGSESVEELIEEGNAFEADAVAGVEDAGDHDGREVHTHEVPQDDVPNEYLDKE